MIVYLSKHHQVCHSESRRLVGISCSAERYGKMLLNIENISDSMLIGATIEVTFVLEIATALCASQWHGKRSVCRSHQAHDNPSVKNRRFLPAPFTQGNLFAILCKITTLPLIDRSVVIYIAVSYLLDR